VVELRLRAAFKSSALPSKTPTEDHVAALFPAFRMIWNPSSNAYFTSFVVASSCTSCSIYVPHFFHTAEPPWGKSAFTAYPLCVGLWERNHPHFRRGHRLALPSGLAISPSQSSQLSYLCLFFFICKMKVW
jgi:hypothetical protein